MKAQVQSLTPDVLDALIRKDHSPEALTQNHNYVVGSMEERCCEVQCAFRKWTEEQAEVLGNSEYYWWYTTVLAIFDDHLLFCVSKGGEYDYFKLSYAVEGNSKVTITGGLTPVDVKLVVEALATSDEDEPMDGATQDSKTQSEEPNAAMKEKAKTQGTDTVGDGTPLEKDIKSSPVEKSDDNPTVDTKTETDADESGATMPDPSDDAESSGAIEHSGDEGVGKGPEGAGPDLVGTEMGKTAAGLKQDMVGNPDFLIQSKNCDQSNRGSAYIDMTQTKVGEANGKKTLVIQGIATRADIINSEGVVYPLSVWESNLPKMNEQAASGKFLGKLEHPDQEQGLVDAAIKWDKFWLEGSDVHFQATVLPTEPYGKNLQALIESGVQVDLSTRGYGQAKQQSWRGQDVKVVQDGFTCVGIDAVWYGASTGSTITDAQRQSKTSKESAPVADKLTQAQTKANDLRAKVEIDQCKSDLLKQSNLTEMGQKAYEQALNSATDLVNLIEVSEQILPILQGTFAVKANDDAPAVSWTPHFMVKQSKEEQAPQTIGEMIDRLVGDLPDENEAGPMGFSQRKACRQIMVNIANEQQGTFSGRRAALGLLALEQGKIERAQDILTQGLATGATVAAANAEGDGAPLSAPLIFPLVRRVFPMYIMNEIASIQPMDRPEGKIFYLDAYRTEDPAGQEKRIDLNTSSSPFNSSYADNATEGAAAQLIRLRLASVLVDAHTKKLGANWSVEEMQDLRAYHGLDAAQELMGHVAREVALEWNKEVLDDMAVQATAAALAFGTTLPAAGFTQQKDWDEYLWVYLQHLDNQIFARRNGPMTHIVAGVDAALALAKSMRGVFTIGGDNGGEMEGPYPGTTFYGMITAPTGGRYKIFKTNFWATGTANGSKILGLRKGADWSDTPYVWAPYTDYVTPILTDPSDFSQKQGIVSRAAKKVVVSDAMGTLTISAAQGVVL
jgi:hypothetical protein